MCSRNNGRVQSKAIADVIEANPVYIKGWLCAKQGFVPVSFKTYDAKPWFSYISG